jgi:hypothetical protein
MYLLDYKVLNIILIRKINIMKVGLLWNDNNKQESLIFEGVMMIRTILHLAREHPNNTTHARS